MQTTETMPKVTVTENQFKVIKDKYLRDAPSVEAWLSAMAFNIALGEIFHCGVAEERIFAGVKYTRKEFDTRSGKPTVIHMLHEGHKTADEQKQNFKRFMKNLYEIAESDPHAKEAVDKAFRKFYSLVASWKFLPNSPTLMNAGRDLQQLSACYVLPVGDSIEEIYDAVKYMAIIHQSGGGTGFDFSRLRPRGSAVQTTKGVSSGPCTFMQLFDKSTEVVKQGGTRRGANMGILRYDHPDIDTFISMKKTPGVMENFNVSVTITEEFMQKVKNNEEYDLIHPKTKQSVGKKNAKEMWDVLVQGAWETGDPGIIMIDRINNSRSNPVPAQGMIESTNPCVTGDMRVATTKGLIPIKELVGTTPVLVTDQRVPVTVYLHDQLMQVLLEENGLFPASQVISTGMKPIYEITTKAGYTLKATADHKVFTCEGKKHVGDLIVGNDKILVQSAGMFSTQTELPVAAQREFNGNNGRTYAHNLPQHWSEELGFVLGWLIGDGWLRTGGKDCRVGWTFAPEDERAKEIITSYLNTIYGKDVKTVERENGVYHLSYHSKYFVAFFEKLGVNAWRSETKRVPESIFRAPRFAVAAFLQALFGADGTVRHHRTKSSSDAVVLTSKSKSLLQDVQLLLLQFGIKSTIMNRNRKARTLFPYTAKDGERRAYLSDGLLYELFICGRSLALFKSHIGFLSETKTNRLHTAQHGNRAISFEDTVVSITALGEAEVFDLTEPATHSFVCNGAVVSNCGEQPLLPYEPCNLGSLNLSGFVKNREFDYAELKTAIWDTVHFLDNVVTVNNYPIAQIEAVAKLNRRIGLGVMGWAEALVLLGLPYNSDAAFRKGEEVMKFVNEEAMFASEALAKQRGAFGGYIDSIFDKDGQYFRGEYFRPRNSARTTIAPTGTIGIAAGLQGAGIEPFFAIVYTRFNAKALDSLKKGETPDPKDTFWEVNPYFEQVAEEHKYFGLTKEELWKKIDENHKSVMGIKEVPKHVQQLFLTSHDLTPLDHVKMQCAFQKYTDNAVSKTVNMANSATPKDINDVYMLAFELGAKGVTVYRDGSKQLQVLNLGTKAKEEKAVQITVEVPKQRSFDGLGERSMYYNIMTGNGSLHVHINYDDFGPTKVFANMSPAGTEISGLTCALAILLSKYFELGGDPVRILKHLNSVKGDKPYGFGPKRVDSIAHAISKALRDHLVKTGYIADESGQTTLGAPVETKEKQGDRLYCPKCFSTNVQIMAGCSEPTCFDCGYSKCS